MPKTSECTGRRRRSGEPWRNGNGKRTHHASLYPPISVTLPSSTSTHKFTSTSTAMQLIIEPGLCVEAAPIQARSTQSTQTSLLWCRVAAARELLEETGLDMRESMHRLVPVDFEAMGAKGQKVHQSRRRYFRLDINDSDSVDDIPSALPQISLCHTGVQS